MLKSHTLAPEAAEREIHQPAVARNAANLAARCSVVVIWIDWYAYHLARFEGLQHGLRARGPGAGH